MRLEATKLSKHYGAELIFENVNFFVNDTDIIGLVGNNGCGKSTFCNILARNDMEYDGVVKLYPQAKVAYFKQVLETEEYKEHTVFEYILKTQQKILDIEADYNKMLTRMEQEHVTDAILFEFGELQEAYYNNGANDLLERIQRVLHGLGIYETIELANLNSSRNITWEMKMSELSGGERKIVELATILLDQSANVLILDEPTNHLDMEARAWLEKFIKNFKGSVIIVSHDRHLLNSVAAQIWEIQDHTLNIYKGNYDHFEKQKSENLEALRHQFATQQKEKEKLEAILTAFRRNEKNGGNFVTVKLYNATRSRLERFEKNMMPEPPKDRAELNLTLKDVPPKGYTMVKLENFSFNYDNKRNIFDNQSIVFTKEDKVALLGANGIGKSTFLKLVLAKYVLMHSIDPAQYGIEDFVKKYKETLAHDNSFYVGPGVKVGYYSQHHTQLPKNQTIRELLWQNDIKDESHFQSIIRKYHFTKDTVDEKLISSLSGGEKSKLQFMLLMLSGANTLLLDEPINHLDIDSMKVVEEVLSKFSGAMFVISHDRYFLGKVVNKIVYVKDHKLNEFFGTIDEYLEEKYDVKI